jgi:hypothetical protein
MLKKILKTRYFYKNIFYIGSLLWAGNILEYYINHTEKLVVFYLLPRYEKQQNFVEVFIKGKLKNRYVLNSPKNIFIQYFFLPFQIIFVIKKYFNKNEFFYAVTYHPILFPIKFLLKSTRKFVIVFWIADYIKKGSYSQRLFQFLTSVYQRKNNYNLYLSNRINSIMNGRVRNTDTDHTAMLGVKTFQHILSNSKRRINKIRLLYIGVVKESHGITEIINLIGKNDKIEISILGKCNNQLYIKYLNEIAIKNLSNRIYFPNKYFSDKEILIHAKKSHIGIALYPDNSDNIHYFADPGKVKYYCQLGLPVILSNSSEVSTYIKKFHAGEIIKLNIESLSIAINRISSNYSFYLHGLEKFCNYFNYEIYYRKKMIFMEN